jgi:hypothetical protein
MSCFKAHKLLCNSKGFFGWFCDNCRSFTYHSNKLTSADIKKNHICGDYKPCRNCFLPRTPDHLCPLKKVGTDGFHNRLVFFNFQFSSQNELILATILRETNIRGLFDRSTFFHSNFECSDLQEPNFCRFDYFKSTKINVKYQKIIETTKKDPSFDFNSNINKIFEETNTIEKATLLYFLQKTNVNTTFITMDHQYTNMVRMFMISTYLITKVSSLYFWTVNFVRLQVQCNGFNYQKLGAKGQILHTAVSLN